MEKEHSFELQVDCESQDGCDYVTDCPECGEHMFFEHPKLTGEIYCAHCNTYFSFIHHDGESATVSLPGRPDVMTREAFGK